MIWTIARKQVLTGILTYKFVVGFVLCQLLFSLSAVILTRDYEGRLAAFNSGTSLHTTQLQQAKVYSELLVTIDRRPSPLSPLCEGFDKRFAGSVDVSYTSIPTISVGQTEKNPLMAALDSLDLVAIVQIVLGLLLLLFAYDVVSGEREQGTLAQTLANPVPRNSILAGQYLGGMLTILPVFLMGMGLAVLILRNSRSVSLSAHDWALLGLIILLSILYISVLFLAGMFISIMTRKSATSLVIVLFFWVISVILLPHVSAHLASNLRPIEAKSVVDANARNLQTELWNRLQAYSEQHPRPIHRWEFIKDRSVFTGDVPYPIRIYYAPREVMLWELEGLKYCLRLDMEYAEKTYSLYRNYELALASQAALAGAMGRLSPAWIYYHAASILAGTDSGSFLRFLDQTRRYRRDLIQYVQDKGGLYSSAYFTRIDVEKLPTTQDLDIMKASRGQRAVDNMIGPGWDAVAPLNLYDMPGWDSAPDAFAARVRSALPEAGILLFLNLVLFLAAHVGMLRTDVRPY
ncbi:MAG: ABC transporter permease subunit [Acidobacteriia bacterium]|nr:ABC transporter permease subunit [Terriglobia bacterium]